jgi:hypothetical protein
MDTKAARTMTRYYLSSLDSYVLEAVRACDFIEVKHFDTGKECAIAKLDPPIPGHAFGLVSDVVEVVLAARHEGDVLSKIREFPCFVHVARSVLADIRNQGVIIASDLENLAWGELYRSKHDAENHVFDRR